MPRHLYLYLIVINYTHTRAHKHRSEGRQKELIWRKCIGRIPRIKDSNFKHPGSGFVGHQD